ncbi:hypothetical protein R80B4_01241 [Fibrobacteres bacterium R8-0-B4]
MLRNREKYNIINFSGGRVGRFYSGYPPTGNGLEYIQAPVPL